VGARLARENDEAARPETAPTLSRASQSDFEKLLRSVDKALYRAKVHRDRVEVVEMADL
jgi:hypothetical protein